ncbi:MAG TPA: ATP-binding protein [Acidimicrobiales bacterium]|jgi:anti-sigma regulatory factor (Ser/Thr protein kinase)|nr:ATP-binding protein [Acidimicrobiales bacterium]
MPSQSFDPRIDQVRSARHFAEAVARRLGCATEEVALVVSELAANACQHAQTPFEVSIERHDSALLVELLDHGPNAVFEMEPPLTAERGRGVRIVATVARSWGVRPHSPEGKLVWAELDCRPLHASTQCQGFPQ